MKKFFFLLFVIFGSLKCMDGNDLNASVSDTSFDRSYEKTCLLCCIYTTTLAGTTYACIQGSGLSGYSPLGIYEQDPRYICCCCVPPLIFSTMSLVEERDPHHSCLRGLFNQWRTKHKQKDK